MIRFIFPEGFGTVKDSDEEITVKIVNNDLGDEKYPKEIGFHPLTTWRLEQTGYPYPNKGQMFPHFYGGTSLERHLIPSSGEYVRLIDLSKLTLVEIERWRIERALVDNDFNYRKAATTLGIKIKTLREKIINHDILEKDIVFTKKMISMRRQRK